MKDKSYRSAEVMKKASLFFLLTLFFLSMTSTAYSSNDFGILRGKIFDAQSKEGIGGIQIVIENNRSKFAVQSDSFGSFILKLEPGQYFALVQGVHQKIAFYIFPGKTALLDIPVKASALPQPIHYTVQYHPIHQKQPPIEQNPPAQPQSSKPESSRSEKVVQPFIKSSNPPSTKQAEPSKPIISPPTEKYPMSGMVVPMKPKRTIPKNTAPALAIMPFKDSTDNGLGMQTSRDIADYLFDLGKIKVIGPHSITGAIGGLPADPLNGAFAQWIARKLGANEVVLGRIKKAQIVHHQYFFFVTAGTVITAVIQVMDVKTGNIITTFTRTASSGMFGTSGNKNRYYKRKTIKDLFKRACKNMAHELGDQLLKIEHQNTE